MKEQWDGMGKATLENRTANPMVEPAISLDAWPLSVQNNPRRIKDLPRLAVPMFGPLGPGAEVDPEDPAGQAD